MTFHFHVPLENAVRPKSGQGLFTIFRILATVQIFIRSQQDVLNSYCYVMAAAHRYYTAQTQYSTHRTLLAVLIIVYTAPICPCL